MEAAGGESFGASDALVALRALAGLGSSLLFAPATPGTQSRAPLRALLGRQFRPTPHVDALLLLLRRASVDSGGESERGSGGGSVVESVLGSAVGASAVVPSAVSIAARGVVWEVAGGVAASGLLGAHARARGLRALGVTMSSVTGAAEKQVHILNRILM
ncbi:hypothetical protein T492DRAFT_35934 [Pavlovales sp. CCMP2436]|nr:hypothetical protein T492DRAFT_35934 [Pavlovales sp. CCMP2436]